MIDGIFQWRKDKVKFDKIITEDTIITDIIQIKDYTRKYFENWTKENLPTENLQLL